jgi:hypothetical protein
MSPDHTIAASVSSFLRSSAYELPLMLRIWPFAGARDVDALAEHDEPHGVAHLAEHAHATLQLGVPQILDALQALRELLLVPGDAGEAGLPRQRVRAPRVEVGVLQARVEVGHRVGHVRLVEGLRVARGDPDRGHPVGEADGIRTDVLTQGELVAHLREVRVVVVDRDVVVDGQTGLLHEGLERRMVAVVVLVEVERPVRPRQRLLRRGEVLARTGGRGGAGAADAARAGGQERRERQRTGAADQAAPAELRGSGLCDEGTDGGVFGQGSTGHGALLKRCGTSLTRRRVS